MNNKYILSNLHELKEYADIVSVACDELMENANDEFTEIVGSEWGNFDDANDAFNAVKVAIVNLQRVASQDINKK